MTTNSLLTILPDARRRLAYRRDTVMAILERNPSRPEKIEVDISLVQELYSLLANATYMLGQCEKEIEELESRIHD